MGFSYRDALAFLFPRTTTIKFGLERTEALLERLGRPDRLTPVVHIGGTNGKGSVATLVAAALTRAGWRTGLFTSPHLISFRERMRVDGAPIPEEAVAMWVELLQPLIIESGATFFEVNTALAFTDFAARGAEIAVVEVGLGGRLDSTNVVRPLVSAVTKVALDHQAYLGHTLDAIATEKAGIAKPGAPFVVGEADPSVVAVLAREARHAVHRLDPAADLDLRAVPPDATYEAPLRLAGAHQRRNAAVARAILEALPVPWRPDSVSIAKAFADTVVPGRLDRRGRWLFDVAHNPDGMRALVRALRDLAVPGPVHALVSILGDKAWPEMLVTLDAAVDLGILTVAPSADSRRWNLRWLSEWLGRTDRPPARAEWHLVPDFGQALGQVQAGAGTIVVTGSFHTVGDVMQALGME